MVDLGPVKAVMQNDIIYMVLLGIALIVGSLSYKKLETWLKNKKH